MSNHHHRERGTWGATALIVLLLVVSRIPAASAEDGALPECKSYHAKAAIAQYDAEVARAEQIYLAAVKKAQVDFRADLQVAKREAMKANNLDEANAIQARLDQLTPVVVQKKTATVTVHAAAGWQEICEVETGTSVLLRAQGKWVNVDTDQPVGPKGVLSGKGAIERRGFPNLALIGKIDDGPIFLIGEETTFEPDHSGKLYMVMNRRLLDWTRGVSGSMTVGITISPVVPKVPEPAKPSETKP